MAIPGKGSYPFHVEATVSEIATLSNVSATLDWNDGTPIVAFAPGDAHGATPYTVDSTRDLAIGTYFITLTARNYRSPVPDTAVSHFTVEIQPDQYLAETPAHLFGPILPADAGYPGVLEWNFNMGKNLEVLRSNIKLLLSTQKGERLMNPSYGTRLRQIVFEPNDDSISGIVQQEVESAISLYEPRVAIEAIDVSRTGPREVFVNIRFISKIDQTSFDLSLPFAQ